MVGNLFHNSIFHRALPSHRNKINCTSLNLQSALADTLSSSTANSRKPYNVLSLEGIRKILKTWTYVPCIYKTSVYINELFLFKEWDVLRRLQGRQPTRFDYFESCSSVGLHGVEATKCCQHCDAGHRQTRGELHLESSVAEVVFPLALWGRDIPPNTQWFAAGTLTASHRNNDHRISTNDFTFCYQATSPR